MSSISSMPPAALNLASSLSGGARSDLAPDRAKAASADQKAQVDRGELLTNAMGDVADANLESERDADGRLLYRRTAHEGQDGEEATQSQSKTVKTGDAFGDRGTTLDLEA